MPRPGPRPLRALALLAALGALLLGGWLGGLQAVRALAPGDRAPRLTHEVVVQQVRQVARLVTGEATLRDVVAFEDRWYGSTKRALVVATGRVHAGIDLGAPGDSLAPAAVDVGIDEAARRLTVTIPPARVLAIEVVDLRTYDESAGLWNPFRPADRDAIHRAVRERLGRAAVEGDLLRQADRSAVVLLRALLARDGWTVEVRTRGGAGEPRPAAG